MIDAKADQIFDKHFAWYLDEFYSEPHDDLSFERVAPDTIQACRRRACLNLCESPIEQIMLSAMCFMSKGYGCHPVPIWHPSFGGKPYKGGCIIPQMEVGQYRIDFGLCLQGFDGSQFMLAVECDGHEWHEKTPGQAAKDRKRDRYLQLHGLQTMRFTGSEVWNDPEDCADEVGQAACDFYEVTFPAKHRTSKTFLNSRRRQTGFIPPYSLQGELIS